MEGSQPVAIVGAREEHERRITVKLERELGPVVMAALKDPTVIEIMLNPDGTLWVERLGEPMRQFSTMLCFGVQVVPT